MQGEVAIRRLKGGWVEQRSAEGYVLAREWPPRLDVSAMSTFPDLSASRLARQIRQDLWRALKNMRGFSPIVQIHFTLQGMTVTAGGRVCGRAPRGIASQIQALLDNPANRERWITWARRRTQ